MRTFYQVLFRVVFLPAMFMGCASGTESLKISVPEEIQGPKTALIVSDFDSVWRAAQIALEKYPIEANDMDSGVIRTSVIKGAHIWIAPHETEKDQAGLRSIITIRIIKGKLAEGKEACRITVSKKVWGERGFFDSSKDLKSDGLEESALLYRIQREISVYNAVEASASSKRN